MLFRSCVPPFVGSSFINYDETIGIIVYFEGTVWKVLLVRFLFFSLLLEEFFIAIGEWGMLVNVIWFEEV
jgi:hypothetical protein